MTLKLKKIRGFTLIEITLVIIVMGILASAIAPMFAGMVGRAQADAERAKLKVLKEVLLADALEKGGFVDPLTDATVLATNTPNAFTAVQSNRYLPASANGLALGLPITSGFNNAGGDLSALNAVPQYYDGRPASFLYDVHASLTRTVAGVAATPLAFCTNAAAALTAAAASPQVCQRASGNDALVACQATDQRIPAAMVLVSRGKNRQFEFENLEGFTANGSAAVPVTAPAEVLRTYESPNRGVNYSNDVGAYYDDAVESISMSEVVSACQKRGILATASCPVGQRQVRLFNNTGVPVSYKFGASACVPSGLPTGTEYPLGCASAGTTLVVNQAADCTSGTPVTNNLTLASDVNGDFTTLVTCIATGCTTN